VILDPLLDLFRGKAVTIPPLDGAFRPNTQLDDATSVTPLGAADNIAQMPDGPIASSGNALYRLGGGSGPALLKSFDAPITALAVSVSGEIAVALDSGKLYVDDREEKLPAGIGCITALSYAPDGVNSIIGHALCHPELAELHQRGAIQPGIPGAFGAQNKHSKQFLDW